MRKPLEQAELEGIGWCSIPPWILNREDLSMSEKVLYGRILGLTATHGFCYATNRWLGNGLGLKKDTISKIINQLQEKRLIRTTLIRDVNQQVIGRRIYINQIGVSDGNQIGVSDGNQIGVSDGNAKKRNRDISNEILDKKIYKKVLGDEGNINPSKKENIESLQKTKQLSADRKTLLPYIELFPRDWQKESKFRTAWAEWVQHRKELKKIMTELAASKLINKLLGLGVEKAIHEINRAIESGWQGIYPETMKQSKPKNNDSILYIDKASPDRYDVGYDEVSND